MKNKLLKVNAYLAMLMVLFSLNAVAQSKKIPTPETLSEIYQFNKGKGTLDQLEKGTAKYATRVKAFGLGGAATNYEFPGDKANVRLLTTDSLFFVVSLADGMGDPANWFTLFKATVKKGKRIGNSINSKVFIAKTSEGEGMISFTSKLIGKQLYQIVPSVKLEKGEYFFVNKGTLVNHSGVGADAFAFAID